MNQGLRTYRSASCRIAIATGLPEEMREAVREIVSVYAGNQGKGHAKALMWEVCTEADQWWVTLLIQVCPFDDGMTLEQLKRFYRGFGFREIQDEPCLMARLPETPRIVRVH
jgi:GNAT superfamily N-acetyltransferase